MSYAYDVAEIETVRVYRLIFYELHFKYFKKTIKQLVIHYMMFEQFKI